MFFRMHLGKGFEIITIREFLDTNSYLSMDKMELLHQNMN